MGASVPARGNALIQPRRKPVRSFNVDHTKDARMKQARECSSRHITLRVDRCTRDGHTGGQGSMARLPARGEFRPHGALNR